MSAADLRAAFEGRNLRGRYDARMGLFVAYCQDGARLRQAAGPSFLKACQNLHEQLLLEEDAFDERERADNERAATLHMWEL